MPECTGASLRTSVESGEEVGVVGQGSERQVGWFGLKAEMAEDPSDHVAGHDVRDVPKAATTGGAGQSVDVQAAQHERGPAVVGWQELGSSLVVVRPASWACVHLDDGAGGSETSSARQRWCGESTPRWRIWLGRGRQTRAARRAMRSVGLSSRWVVPSLHGVLIASSTWASGLRRRRSAESGGARGSGRAARADPSAWRRWACRRADRSRGFGLVAAGEGPRCGVAKAEQALASARAGRSALLDARGEEVNHRWWVVELGGVATLLVVLPVPSADE